MTRNRRALRYTAAQVRRITDGLQPHDPPPDPYWQHPGRIRSAHQLRLPMDLPRPQLITADLIETRDPDA